MARGSRCPFPGRFFFFVEPLRRSADPQKLNPVYFQWGLAEKRLADFRRFLRPVWALSLDASPRDIFGLLTTAARRDPLLERFRGFLIGRERSNNQTVCPYDISKLRDPTEFSDWSIRPTSGDFRRCDWSIALISDWSTSSDDFVLVSRLISRTVLYCTVLYSPPVSSSSD